ncbi:hypothetical protein GTW56_18425 [Bacillus sp. EB93]|nr:hypothetical protein [Peribacillus frigoritolerans]
MEILRISHGEAKTLSTIMALMTQEKCSTVFASYAELAELTGFNIRNVRKQVTSLCEKEILIKTRKGIGSREANAYSLCKSLNDEWVKTI